MQTLDVSQLAKDLQCLEEFDPEYNCPVLDEDKVRLSCISYLAEYFYGFL